MWVPCTNPWERSTAERLRQEPIAVWIRFVEDRVDASVPVKMASFHGDFKQTSKTGDVEHQEKLGILTSKKLDFNRFNQEEKGFYHQEN